MSTRTFSFAIGAGQTVPLPAGVFFLVTRAASAITITTRGVTGSPTEFSNIGAGLSYGPVPESKRWTYLDVFSAAAQTVEVVVSDDAEVRVGSVVSVSGSVTTLENPSASITSPVDIAIAATTTDAASVPANAARRRITIGVLSTAGGAIRVSATGATGRGVEIAPGTYQEFKTTAALGIRNDGASGTSFYLFEEA